MRARFPNTIELAIAAMIFAILIGVVAGIISATKQYSAADYSVMGIALFGISMPVFWLGIMLMMIFGVFLGWLPIGGRIDLLIPFHRVTGFMVFDSIITGNGAALISVLRHLILPAIALGYHPYGDYCTDNQVKYAGRYCDRILYERNEQRAYQNAKSSINMQFEMRWSQL